MGKKPKNPDSFETFEIKCKCGERLYMATGVTADEPPRPGDVTVCMYCLQIYMFNIELIPGPVSLEYMKKISSQESFLALTVTIDAIVEFNKNNNEDNSS